MSRCIGCLDGSGSGSGSGAGSIAASGSLQQPQPRQLVGLAAHRSRILDPLAPDLAGNWPPNSRLTHEESKSPPAGWSLHAGA